jgi:hypothetical protein
MKITPGWLKQNIFLNQKCIAKNLNKLFCFRGLQYAFDDNLSVTHVFIKQIFRAVEVAPPPPFSIPHMAVQGVGSSGSFQPQAGALFIAMKQ